VLINSITKFRIWRFRPSSEFGSRVRVPFTTSLRFPHENVVLLYYCNYNEWWHSELWWGSDASRSPNKVLKVTHKPLFPPTFVTSIHLQLHPASSFTVRHFIHATLKVSSRPAFNSTDRLKSVLPEHTHLLLTRTHIYILSARSMALPTSSRS
jgi:hypothetical protein